MGPVGEVVEWPPDGAPRSTRFHDIYHPRSGAAAQAVSVFLAGCGLPQSWRGQNRFTVLETGFGLGLNFLTTWAAWEADRQACDQLHFVSVEAYPVAAADIVRATLAPGLETDKAPPLSLRVAALARELALAWKPPMRGIQRLRFADGRVGLTLVVDDVLPALSALDCIADAVYLDGFSPALNPDMWSSATLQAVALHCRAGTRLATYTTTREVRDRLQPLGFTVERRKGLAPKRHRLEAVFSPWAVNGT